MKGEGGSKDVVEENKFPSGLDGRDGDSVKERLPLVRMRGVGLSLRSIDSSLARMGG